MEFAADHLVWGTILIFLPSFMIFLRKWKISTKKTLPPGPPGWPILGNILDLGTMPHKSLSALRKIYGPVIWLRLGSLNTMVILSPSAATEFFKNHDVAFADRRIPESGRVHGYHQSSLALRPYGPFWRAMRRILSVDILVNRRINETVPVRKRCLEEMLIWIEEEAMKDKSGKGIPVVKFVFLTSYNLLGKLMLSRDFLDPLKEGKNFFDVVKGLMEWSGYANLADYFPWLKRWDLQGLKRNMERDLGRAIEIAGSFVKERVKEKKVGEEIDKDFLDVLLEFEGNGKDEPAKLSEKDATIFILEIFMAGAETTSSSIEWALTELLRNPESLIKLKAELSTVIGQTRKIEESDIDHLPYLQAVIKEILRLHPPVPFLIPRKAVKDTNFMGFHIPTDTQVLVNAWSIGRDPEFWEDPNGFKPERFVESKVDYKGQDLMLIPFGAGRRMCPGLPLGHRMLHMTLGYLIQHFDWEFGDGISPENVDMDDLIGITMRKRHSLFAVPKKCV